MKAKELRTLTRAELEQRLREAQEELFNLKFQHKTGQLNNPLRIREVRKDIARLVTLLGEGAVRDPVRAYLWLSLARLQGDERANGPRRDLMAKMTREEITMGKKRVRRWLEEHPDIHDWIYGSW